MTAAAKMPTAKLSPAQRALLVALSESRSACVAVPAGSSARYFDGRRWSPFSPRFHWVTLMRLYSLGYVSVFAPANGVEYTITDAGRAALET